MLSVQCFTTSVHRFILSRLWQLHKSCCLSRLTRHISQCSCLIFCNAFYGMSTSLITATTCRLKVTSNRTLFVRFCASSVQHSIYFDCKSKRCTVATSRRKVSLRLLGGKYVHICDALHVIIMHICGKSMWLNVPPNYTTHTCAFLSYQTF